MPRPRPKRSRVAAVHPTKAPSPAPEEHQQSSATPPVVAKPAAVVAQLPTSDIYDVSDREKERIRQRAAEAAKTSAQPRRTRASQQLDLDSEQTHALEDSMRRRDNAMSRLDDLTSTSRPDQAESPDMESAAEKQPRLTDASGLDLDDSVFANLDDSLDDTESVIAETQTGYRSTDTSTFNVAMFKRRPRQSSVAGRDDAPIRPSSRGQNTPSISTTLNFGNFRRRAREPSILGTARKPRAQRSQSRASQASRNASVLGDGDDSGPDGESTPIDRTRRKTRASLAANGSREGSPAPASRKRKSLESHDGREKRPAVEPEAEEEEEEEAEEIIHQSIEIEVARTPSPPRGRARDRELERFSTPAQDDPDMAPPLSSSPESNSPVAWPALDTLAHRTYTRKPPARAAKTPELDNDASSDLSSPPSLTHSPNYVAPAKAAPPKKTTAPQKKVTTADLTALLPRRRTKPSNRTSDSNDPFDLDASEDERYEAAANGEDEMSYVESRAARKKKAPSKAAANRKGGKVAAEAVSKKRSLRTYGSMNEDKENDVAEDEIVVGSGAEEVDEEVEAEAGLPVAETSQMMGERLGKELHEAAKKFKEVDKWELSFEAVTQSSSPEPLAR